MIVIHTIWDFLYTETGPRFLCLALYSIVLFALCCCVLIYIVYLAFCLILKKKIKHKYIFMGWIYFYAFFCWSWLVFFYIVWKWISNLNRAFGMNQSPSGLDIFCLKNFDTFTRAPVRVCQDECCCLSTVNISNINFTSKIFLWDECIFIHFFAEADWCFDIQCNVMDIGTVIYHIHSL